MTDCGERRARPFDSGSQRSELVIFLEIDISQQLLLVVSASKWLSSSEKSRKIEKITGSQDDMNLCGPNYFRFGANRAAATAASPDRQNSAAIFKYVSSAEF
jgi:hypothetical protein